MSTRDSETQRVLGIFEDEAPRYDRKILFFERVLFGDGRRWVCAQAEGDVLEIAVGTGRNLAHYPSEVRLTGIELSPAMLELARRRAQRVGREVDLRVGDAQALDFEDERFDTVVCTLSLCTIPDDRAAVAEVRRVLRPGGPRMASTCAGVSGRTSSRRGRFAFRTNRTGGRPADSALVFPGRNGLPWTLAAYQSWRRRIFDRARTAAGAADATPYTLRHSFCSLLIAEGRSVIYVARQLGHGAALTLGTYGHVIDELDGAEKVDAEAAIRAARAGDVPVSYPQADVAQS